MWTKEFSGAKWIRENYIDYGRDHLGNKATGMNVHYASDPYWGEKIASIMMTINSKLGWERLIKEINDNY